MSTTDPPVDVMDSRPAPVASRDDERRGGWARALRILLVIVAGAGWLVAADLIRIRTGQAAQIPLLARYCGSDEAGGASACQSLLASPRASLRLGPGWNIPWVALGAGYFSSLFVWYLFLGLPARGRRFWHIIPTLVVVIGAMVSIHLTRILLGVLDRPCMGCLLVHACNAVLTLLTLLAWSVSPSSAGGPYPRTSHGLCALTTAGFALLFQIQSFSMLFSAAQLAQVSKAYEKMVRDPVLARAMYNAAPSVPIQPEKDDLSIGPADAAQTIVCYTDLQCENCRTAHQLLVDLAAANPDTLRVIFRHYPVDPACNEHPKARGSRHIDACIAARAAAAARIAGGNAGGLAFVREAFANQSRLGERPFAEWAAAAGIDPAAFERAMASGAAADRVEMDVQSGNALDLGLTPAIFLDGRRVEYWTEKETWAALLSNARPAR